VKLTINVLILPLILNIAKSSRVQCHSRSPFSVPIKTRVRLPKVLSVSNSKICILSNGFQNIAEYWSNFRCQQGMPVFNALVRDEPLNSGLQNLASRNWETSFYGRCKAYFNILNCLGVTRTSVQTGGRTDGRTD